MRKYSGAKKSNQLCLSLIILIIVGVIVSLLACSNTVPIVEIAVEGIVYAGARVPVSVIIRNLEISQEEVSFDIVQENEYACFEDEMLVIYPSTPTGASFDIVVYVENNVYTKKCIVQKTPVEDIELLEIEPLKAGDTCLLEVVFNPVRASENEIEFEIIKGKDAAVIENGLLKLSQSASKGEEIIIIAKSGGKVSNEVCVTITSIFAESIVLSVTGSAYAGESVELQHSILPKDANEGKVVYMLTKGESIASINANMLSIDELAVVGQKIEIFAEISGIKSNTLEIIVKEKKAEEINLFVKYFDTLEVKLGETRELYAEINPYNATFQDWQIVITEGSAELDGNRLIFSSGKEGDIIKVEAKLGNITSNELIFIIQKTAVEKVEILIKDEQSVAVAPYETREVCVVVTPLEATYPDYELTIEQGEEFVLEEEGVYTFLEAPVGTEVRLRAYADGVYSESVVFTIVPIPVESILISTDSPINNLKEGDTVVFDSYVLPVKATYSQLTYKIISGQEYGTITTDGVFVVSANATMCMVMVQAVSADGVESNVIGIDIKGSFVTYTPTTWKSIDNRPTLFDGYSALYLDLSKMPLEASNTTIIFSTDIQYLVIEGGYANTPTSCITNLNMYFLTSSTINATFKDFGIIITERFGGTVIDFGTKSNIILTIEGNSYIQAGSPYAPYYNDFTVNGEWSAASTNYIRKHGMDGFGGYDGGTAISANNLTVKGEGKLTVKAGSGSSGTKGGNGADTPEITSQSAGNGGNGGYGGDSGFAIYANNISFDFEGTIYAYGGDGGKGGKGGAGGLAVFSNHGLAGIDGQNGRIHNPIYAYGECTLYSGLVNNVYTGQIIDVVETRTDNLVSFVEVLESYYKIDLHYGTDFWNPYKPTILSWRGKYKMTQQNNTQEILRLLHGLEGAICIFPKNMFIELGIVNREVNIYLVNTIRNSADNIVYGLTSNANNIWFATFDTRLRDTFYSTYYNIMIHEILHLLTFSMGSTTTNPMRSGLPQHNLGYGYIVNAQGVYDPENGYGANNSAFLTKYSKTDFNEDISDNISIICMLVYRPDFLQEGKAIYQKSKYIANIYRNYYNSFAYYIPTPWERLTWKY